MDGAHQKRMLAYGEWLEETLLSLVPHRQYVFALPKLIRPFFRYRRRYLGQLCRLGAELLKTGFKAIEPRGQPAFILYVQTFGDLVTFNPHMTAMDGGNAGNARAITCPCPGSRWRVSTVRNISGIAAAARGYSLRSAAPQSAQFPAR